MRKFVILLICLALICPLLCAQAKAADKKDPKAPDKPAPQKAIAPPTNLKQAKELFTKAWELEREQKFDDALKHYNVLIVYFRQLKGP